MNNLTFDDFTIIPLSQDPANAIWFLYHPETSAYVLDCTRKTSKKGRIAALSSPNTRPEFTSWVDSKLSFKRKARRYISSPLPKNAPKGGPELLKIALAALRHGYECRPLTLRHGRTLEDMKALLAALHLIGQHRKLKVMFTQLLLNGKPDTPIADTERSNDGPKSPELSVLEDLMIWFAPRAELGPDCASALGRKGENRHALAYFATGVHTEPSAHDLMEAGAVVAAFYEKAAPELNLTADQLRYRYQALGLG